MPSGGVTGLEGVYSPYGEFQALLRKWINREVCVHAVVDTSCSLIGQLIILVWPPRLPYKLFSLLADTVEPPKLMQIYFLGPSVIIIRVQFLIPVPVLI